MKKVMLRGRENKAITTNIPKSLEYMEYGITW